MTEREFIHALAKKKAEEEGIGLYEWCGRHGTRPDTLKPHPSGYVDMNLSTLKRLCKEIGVSPWKVLYAVEKYNQENKDEAVCL